MAPKIAALMTSKPAGRFLYRLIGAYAATFRLIVENERPWRRHLANGGRVLLCCWHQQFFSLIRPFRRYRDCRPSLMISQSSDGELIAGVARLSGWRAVRGSSSRDGRKALHEMIQQLQATGLAAHVVDGPRGPAGHVKRGAIHLAQAAGAHIVPVYASSSRAWRFNSWDRFLLPQPFSQVTIRFGPMIPALHSPDATGIETRRLALETAMQPALVR